MPRDLNGIYSLPPSNPVVPGSVITSTWANSTMADLVAELNALRRLAFKDDVDMGDLNTTGIRDGTRYLRGDGVWETPTGGGGGDEYVNNMTLTYDGNGHVTKITQDLVDTNVVYNPDGTVNTVSYPRGALTRTETYHYSSGVLTGMTASEA